MEYFVDTQIKNNNIKKGEIINSFNTESICALNDIINFISKNFEQIFGLSTSWRVLHYERKKQLILKSGEILKTKNYLTDKKKFKNF